MSYKQKDSWLLEKDGNLSLLMFANQIKCISKQMKKILSKLILITVIIVTFTLVGIAPSQAITFNFTWNGNSNYSAKGSFSYDESIAPKTFAENGSGKTNFLKMFNISFFNNLNEQIAVYNNVANSISSSNSFKFSFNTVTHEIFGVVDLGGEIAGETYLSGTMNNNLSLFQVPQSGSDLVIDSNSGSIIAKTVSQPSPSSYSSESYSHL